MIVGNSKALKSEMINTFINPNKWSESSSEKDVQIPKRAHYSRNTVRRQAYEYADVFLILINVEDVVGVEIQYLANEVSRVRPRTPFLLVGTSQGPGTTHGVVKLERIAKSFFDSRKKLVFCNVLHPMSVGRVFAQVGFTSGPLFS
ncbi:hypothetical protein CSPX01_13138 [Colletotrichum filicis]|nr:hypothetical protein CSPX01_13138 [Colletotrichum filicis]